MTGSATDSDEIEKDEQPEWWVNIRAYGPGDKPGEARHRQYIVNAKDSDKAKEKAVDKAKNHFTKSIIDRRDNYDIVEVSGPHE